MPEQLRRIRDPSLLDALDACERTSFSGFVYRVVRDGRDPLEPSHGGRWDAGFFDVLYTAFEEDGAIAEIDFQLNSQPVFPSRYRARLYELEVRTVRCLRLSPLDLERLEVEMSRYREILYARTSQIGDAAAFLDFDSLIAPSACWSCQNMMLFTDAIPPANLAVRDDRGHVDFAGWRASKKSRKRRVDERSCIRGAPLPKA